MNISLSYPEIQAIVQAAYPRPNYILFSFFKRVINDPECGTINFNNCMEYFAGLVRNYPFEPEYREWVFSALSEFLLNSTNNESLAKIAIAFKYLKNIFQADSTRVTGVYDQLTPEVKRYIKKVFSLPD